MLYEYKNELPDSWVYWCNSTGDFHRNGEYWIDDIEGLPKELQVAFSNLWSESFWASCYVVEFDGKYCIALEAEYGDCDDNKISIIRNKANECSNRYQEYDVIFGDSTLKWGNGEAESELFIVMPWDIDANKFNSVARWFDSMCYDGLC